MSASHAVVIAVAGLVLGLPSGLALGRLIWSQMAHATPLTYIPPTPTTLLWAAVPVTVLLAFGLAIPAGARCARLPVAAELPSG